MITRILLLSILFSACASLQSLGPESLKNALDGPSAWLMKVTATATWGSEASAERQRIILSMRMKILQRNEGKPVSLEFTDVSGPQIISRIVNGVEKETERMENREGRIVSMVDPNFILYDARDLGHLSNDILLIFPPGPCLGFLPPPRAVRPGESWRSGDIVPAGPRTIKKGQIRFSGIAGQYKLEEIRNGIAVISWKGNADAAVKNGDAVIQGKAEWQRRILFNLKTSRLKESDGAMTISLPEGMKFTYDVSIKVGD